MLFAPLLSRVAFASAGELLLDADSGASAAPSAVVARLEKIAFRVPPPAGSTIQITGQGGACTYSGVTVISVMDGGCGALGGFVDGAPDLKLTITPPAALKIAAREYTISVAAPARSAVTRSVPVGVAPKLDKGELPPSGASSADRWAARVASGRWLPVAVDSEGRVAGATAAARVALAAWQASPDGSLVELRYSEPSPANAEVAWSFQHPSRQEWSAGLVHWPTGNAATEIRTPLPSLLEFDVDGLGSAAQLKVSLCDANPALTACAAAPIAACQEPVAAGKAALSSTRSAEPQCQALMRTFGQKADRMLLTLEVSGKSVSVGPVKPSVGGRYVTLPTGATSVTLPGAFPVAGVVFAVGGGAAPAIGTPAPVGGSWYPAGSVGGSLEAAEPVGAAALASWLAGGVAGDLQVRVLSSGKDHTDVTFWVHRQGPTPVVAATQGVGVITLSGLGPDPVAFSVRASDLARASSIQLVGSAPWGAGSGPLRVEHGEATLCEVPPVAAGPLALTQGNCRALWRVTGGRTTLLLGGRAWATLDLAAVGSVGATFEIGPGVDAGWPPVRAYAVPVEGAVLLPELGWVPVQLLAASPRTAKMGDWLAATAEKEKVAAAFTALVNGDAPLTLRYAVGTSGEEQRTYLWRGLPVWCRALPEDSQAWARSKVIGKGGTARDLYYDVCVDLTSAAPRVWMSDGVPIFEPNQPIAVSVRAPANTPLAVAVTGAPGALEADYRTNMLAYAAAYDPTKALPTDTRLDEKATDVIRWYYAPRLPGTPMVVDIMSNQVAGSPRVLWRGDFSARPVYAAAMSAGFAAVAVADNHVYDVGPRASDSSSSVIRDRTVPVYPELVASYTVPLSRFGRDDLFPRLRAERTACDTLRERSAVSVGIGLLAADASLLDASSAATAFNEQFLTDLHVGYSFYFTPAISLSASGVVHRGFALREGYSVGDPVLSASTAISTFTRFEPRLGGALTLQFSPRFLRFAGTLRKYSVDTSFTGQN